jgi:hypothetical protein
MCAPFHCLSKVFYRQIICLAGAHFSIGPRELSKSLLAVMKNNRKKKAPFVTPFLKKLSVVGQRVNRACH